MRITIGLLIMIFGTPLMMPSQAHAGGSQSVETDVEERFDQTHRIWTGSLKRFVRNGVVDYGAWRNARQDLDRYLSVLAAVEKKRLAGFSRKQQLAYWINAYNAATVQLILDRGPVKSIRDIEKPWDQPRFSLAGRSLSLNQIEHEIIRPRFKEPRIHFALVCAAKSCPPLRAQAYTAAGLDKQLAWATSSFLKGRFNEVSPKRLRLSKIFEWYGGDFAPEGSTSADAGIRAFVRAHSDIAVSDKASIEYLEYDWSLNGSF